MRRKELETAIQAAADGTISADEFDQLQATLRESAEARSFYRHSMRVEQALIESWPPASVRPTGVVPVNELLRRQRKRAVVMASAVAAAVVLLAGGLLWQWLLPPDLQNMISVKMTPGSILSAGAGEGIEIGRAVNLPIGVAQFKLPGGSDVVVEGPAVLRFQSGRQIILDHGKAVITVSPKDAKSGFEVWTQQGIYRDLGTKFGLGTRPNDLDELVIFEGRVEAISRLAVQEKRIFKKGDAVKLSPIGRWSPIKVSEDQFLHQLPSALPGIHFGFDGNDLMAPDGLHPAVKGMSVRTMGGGEPVLTTGVRGRGLRFNKQGDTLDTNWPGIGGSAARTVACWIKPEASEFDFSPFLGWGVGAAKRGRWNLVVAKHPLTDNRVLRLSLSAQLSFSGSTTLRNGEWYSVAAVFRGGARDGEDLVELYVNGRREDIDPSFSNSASNDTAVDTLIESPESVPLVIGRGPYIEKPAFFHGEIDEIHIFPYALTVNAIKAMATIPESDIGGR